MPKAASASRETRQPVFGLVELVRIGISCCLDPVKSILLYTIHLYFSKLIVILIYS
jgi:hypothetical protein